MASTSASQSSLVLITGASGFVGSQVALEALQAGYSIRLVFRKALQAEQWREKYPDLRLRTQTVVVPDFTAEGAFDEAMKGVESVAACAFPMVFAPQDIRRDLLDPAIEGVLGVLKSAQKEGVKRVVITSSIVSYINFADPPASDYLITEKDWAPYTARSSFYLSLRPRVLTARLAMLAEMAAWDFVEREKPTFTLTSINPAFILGHNSSPSLSWTSATSSYAFTSALVDAPAYTAHPLFVNVLDVARSHIAAFTTPAAAGKRYALVAGAFTNEQLGRLAGEAVPEQAHRFPPQPEQAPKVEERLKFDAGEAEKDFGFKCELYPLCTKRAER
ncbi:hypothetical protein BCR35DRAFT_263736 [Leucosporidium creatinivorum]|uniref:NAD-dependent epimerase/dehydratase domain-containing protein n=1 Tax=Leucosporidium creatinivorum TaxID=106004 RepID=A0A1Y2FWY9_9BASI|nr:hypothetical protein BCR35DRAFT_263736 [Leucosporidium creatinivorum]